MMLVGYSAGIGVKMITGDHLGTASAIGREMGIGEQRGAIAAPQPREWLLPLGIGVAVLLIVELDKAVARAVSARAQRRRSAG